ncbi:MAG: hypothetical protein HGN29_17010 [Asgard group archaeon]|nr:hypothetical protein [Asgard group archaeon]
MRKSQKKLENDVDHLQILPLLYPLGYMIRTVGSIVIIYALFDLFEPKPMYDGAVNHLPLPYILEMKNEGSPLIISP